MLGWTRKATGAAAALFLLGACETMPTVNVELDEAIDFDTYETFAWGADAPVQVGGEIYVSQFVAQRMLNTASDILSEKGFVPVEKRSDADFLLLFTLGAVRTVDVDYIAPGLQDVDEDVRGRMFIEIFDGQTKKPIWIGKSEKEVYDSEIDNIEEGITEALTLILSEFPPTPDEESDE
ncbi:MAG: DUF4136 domain-containing protein [Pseudomonadota bacterium]